MKVEVFQLADSLSELKPLLLMRESCRVYFVDYYDDGDGITRGKWNRCVEGIHLKKTL